MTGAPGLSLRRIVGGVLLPGAAVSVLAVAACGAPPPLPPYDAAAHAADVETWREWRHGELVKPDGWLSLSGLYWLPDGVSSFGAGDADFVYRRDGVADRLGVFRVEADRVWFTADDAVEVTSEEQALRGEILMYEPEVAEGDRPRLTWRELQWYVILRQDHLAVRLKDARSALIVDFDGMENFDLAPDWRFDATFEFHEPPKIIKVPNVFGSLGDVESPGAVVFEHGGDTYRIDMWKDSDDPANFFTAFGDATNGGDTYGAGRFLWVDAPDAYGRTVVDFNRAYNPPCAFSAFATCPLPPAQNRLPLEIRAGEKKFGTTPGTIEGPPQSEPLSEPGR